MKKEKYWIKKAVIQEIGSSLVRDCYEIRTTENFILLKYDTITEARAMADLLNGRTE